MGVRVRTKRASSNLVFTLSSAAFEAGLRKVLAEDPDLLALQEAGPNRDHIIAKVCKELGYAWARAKGGAPVLWKVSRYGEHPRSVRPVRLAGAEYVGHLPGRKDRLPASIATEVCLDDLLDPKGGIEVFYSYHFTADIQDVRGGNGYKKGLKYFLRVMRHKREKRRLGSRMRRQQRHAREVSAAGDGNFSGMTIGGFVNCWEDRHGGTLGGRPVDIVFADRKPIALKTLETPSDHDTLICTY
jgi:hypothetical protein